jgi:4-diphosphocytidyl-2C-methyl-D-erythritol kinase
MFLLLQKMTIEENDILEKINILQLYLEKIGDYITMFEVEDQEHFVNTMQSIYVNTKNLYNELYEIRREEVFSLKNSNFHE